MESMKNMKKYLNFQLQLKNKFSCVALRNARAHFIVRG